MKAWLNKLPSASLLVRQISKKHFFLFSGMVCFFLSNSCQPLPLNNPCDPSSKAYISTFLGKAMIGDKSTHCGISFSTPTASYTGSPFAFPQTFAITTVTPTLAGNAPALCTATPSLPVGLVIDQATCAISGTPTTFQFPTSYTITPANIAGSTNTTISVQVTSDGSTWTARTLPAGNWSSVTFGNDVFVAVANAGLTYRAATSPDGITWTAQLSLPITSNWSSVTFGNGVFVAVAATGTNRAATSPDGITWTVRTLASVAWSSVTFGNGVFVAVAYNSTTSAATSPDGITWTVQLSLPISIPWISATFGNGVFVAVAFASTVAATSPNGITWTTRTLPTGNWFSVTFGNGVFVAVANNDSTIAATSPDGITWTARILPTGNWSSVTFGNGVFVAVANNSLITAATSP